MLWPSTAVRIRWTTTWFKGQIAKFKEKKPRFASFSISSLSMKTEKQVREKNEDSKKRFIESLMKQPTRFEEHAMFQI